MKAMYEKEGGAFPDPLLNLVWPYEVEHSPSPDELAKEMNGYAIDNVMDPADPS